MALLQVLPILIFIFLIINVSYQMRIPEDVEMLDDFNIDMPREIPDEEDTILEARSIYGHGSFRGIRNKRALMYHVLESPGLRSHFHLDNNEDVDVPFSDEKKQIELSQFSQNKGYDKSDSVKLLESEEISDVTQMMGVTHQRYRRSTDEKTSTIPEKTIKQVEITEKPEIKKDDEVLPTAEKQVMEGEYYRRGPYVAKWTRSPLTSDYAKIQEEEDSLAEASAINEGIKARAPRVNFITQQKKLVEPAETREQPNVKTAPELYTPPYDRMRLYDDNYSVMSSRPSYDLYNRRYDRYDRELYDRYPVYNSFEARRRNDGYDSYMPRMPERYYFYPDRRYDIPEIRDYRPLYSNDIADRRTTDYSPSNRNRRIIYYATLPEIVRTSPNVDLRYRSSRYDPLYNRYSNGYYSVADAYRSNRLPRDYIKPGSTTTVRPTRPDSDLKEYTTSPIRITSNLKVQETTRPDRRMFTEISDIRTQPSFQDGGEERDKSYYTRRH